MSTHVILVSSICFAANGQTPNPILSITDIPGRHERSIVCDDAAYPAQERYTLQWLTTPEVITASIIPNNNDATFKRQTRKPKPSDLLLQYNYGAAAVKQGDMGFKLSSSTQTLLAHPCP
jgi:hypothetical protein